MPICKYKIREHSGNTGVHIQRKYFLCAKDSDTFEWYYTRNEEVLKKVKQNKFISWFLVLTHHPKLLLLVMSRAPHPSIQHKQHNINSIPIEYNPTANKNTDSLI